MSALFQKATLPFLSSNNSEIRFFFGLVLFWKEEKGKFSNDQICSKKPLALLFEHTAE